MTLQQLRFLVAVVQSNLNITAAGARLGATQPALSRQLKLLEEELGFNLFVRNGRSFAGGDSGSPAARERKELQNVLIDSRNVISATGSAANIGRYNDMNVSTYTVSDSGLFDAGGSSRRSDRSRGA